MKFRGVSSRPPESVVAEPLSTRTALSVLCGITLFLGALLARGIPMYWDEVYSISVSDRTLSGFLGVLKTDGHGQAPFHTGLWVWLRFSESDWWIRMFSVLGGTVAIALLFILGSRWLTGRVALAVCAVMLANPFFHRYLIDVRGYSWLMAIGLGTVLATDNVLRRDRRSDVIWLGLLAGLGIASQVLFVAVLASLALALLISGSLTPTVSRRFSVSIGIGALVVMPVAYPLLNKGASLNQNAPATLFRLVRVTSSSLGSLPTSPLVVVGILALLASTLQRRERNWDTVCVLCLPIGPAVILTAISLLGVGEGVYNSRYLMPALPFIALAAVSGYRRMLPAPKDTTWLFFVTAAFVVTGLFGPSVHDFVQADPVAAATFLNTNVDDEDSVLFEHAFMQTWVARYWDDRLDVGLLYNSKAADDVQQGLAVSRSLWLVTLESDPSYLEELESDRVSTTRSFGKLNIIELSSLGD